MKIASGESQFSFKSVDHKMVLHRKEASQPKENFIASDDISPDALEHLLDDHRLLFINQLRLMRQVEEAVNPLSGRATHMPLIYLTRLALLKESRDFFMEEARYKYKGGGNFITAKRHIHEQYREYWDSVSRRGFTPFVGTIIVPKAPSVPEHQSYNGIWLGATRAS